MPDARVENHVSIMLVQPMTSEARDWISENVSDEAMFYGSALVVEPRYIQTLVLGMIEAGLKVETPFGELAKREDNETP